MLTGQAHVKVAGYSIAVSCQGTSKPGAPMVMLLAGLGDPYTRYQAIQQQLRGTVRVCAYDRPGEGASSKPTGPVTLQDDVKLLHGVLDAVGADTRVVLVGHSIGGLVAAAYAHAYQKQVTGLLLLDATPPAIVHEILNYIPAQATGIAAEARGEMQSTITTKNPERLKFDGAPIGSLGSIPLIVVHHGKPIYSVVPTYGAKIEQFWTAGQKAWGKLSSHSQVLTATKSGHYIYVDQPALTLQLINKLVTQNKPGAGPVPSKDHFHPAPRSRDPKRNAGTGSG